MDPLIMAVNSLVTSQWFVSVLRAKIAAFASRAGTKGHRKKFRGVPEGGSDAFERSLVSSALVE
jgi:hypothetical protein